MRLEYKAVIVIIMSILFSACDDNIDDNLISSGTSISEEYKIIEQQLDTKTYEEIKDVVKDNQEIALNERTIIIFGRNGCVYCDELKKDIQNSNDIKEVLKNDFELYYINTSYFKIHNINSNNQSKKVSTQDIAKALNINLTPTIMFFNSEGDIKYIYPGYTNKFKELLLETKNIISPDSTYKLINNNLKKILG